VTELNAMDGHQLAAMVSAALTMSPSPLRPLPEYTGRCDCRAESGTLLWRVLVAPGGDVILWFQGDRSVPAVAMTTTSIASMPHRTWIQLPRCNACGATWAARARIVDSNHLELNATRRDLHARAVIAE